MNNRKFKKGLNLIASLTVLWLVSGQVLAQDLEPRRWAHMPTGLNFFGVGVAYTKGDILFDPVLQLEDVTFRNASTAFVYLRSFGLFGKSARIDAVVPYASGRWQGLLEGEPAKTRRRGFGDPRIRLSMLLYGGPEETPQEFSKNEKSNTVVGIGLAVQMPFGHYEEDKLLNLGSNRWVVRPQIGVTHTRNRWTYELTGSVFWYSDNDEFWNGNKLENTTLSSIQGHVIYNWSPGLWVSFSSGYGHGANATINGLASDGQTRNWLSALSLGVPINHQNGLKFAWVRNTTQNDQGADFDSLVVAWSVLF